MIVVGAGSGIAPFVVDFHGDLAKILGENCGTKPAHVLQAHDGVPFNPLELDTMRRSERQGWLKQVYELAEIIADIFPAFGELQQNTIRSVLSDVYKAAGFNDEPAGDREAPLPEALWERLKQLEMSEREVRKINARLSGMFEFNLFAPEHEHTLPLEDMLSQPCILNLSQVTPEDNQRVAASLFLHRIYRWMFGRSGADGLSNALIFDEAHRVAKLKLIPRMMQECRKYGFLFVLSSQRLDDFDQGVIDTAGTQFILKVNYPDARRIANHLAAGVDAKEYVGRLQNLSRYHAIYRTEGDAKVREILLVDPPSGVEPT